VRLGLFQVIIDALTMSALSRGAPDSSDAAQWQNHQPEGRGQIMKWEYQVLRTDTVENFQSSLNKLGSEGWEATSGTYAIGESKKVSLGQGMAPSIVVGASMWVALMKRVIPA